MLSQMAHQSWKDQLVGWLPFGAHTGSGFTLSAERLPARHRGTVTCDFYLGGPSAW